MPHARNQHAVTLGSAQVCEEVAEEFKHFKSPAAY